MNLNVNLDNDTFKFKDIVTRTSQLGLIVMLLSLGITVYYYFLGLLVSSVMVGCFSVSVALILTLEYFNILKNLVQYPLF